MDTKQLSKKKVKIFHPFLIAMFPIIIIYSQNIITSPKNIASIVSQVDVVPTLLHLIGYPYTFEIIGSNILTKSDNKFACRIINDYCIWFDKNFIYTYANPAKVSEKNKVIKAFEKVWKKLKII